MVQRFRKGLSIWRFEPGRVCAHLQAGQSGSPARRFVFPVAQAAPRQFFPFGNPKAFAEHVFKVFGKF